MSDLHDGDANERREEREWVLIGRAQELLSLAKPAVKLYLWHGIMPRLLMLQAGRRFFHVEAAESGEPRSPEAGTMLMLHANAYYLNVRGLLDNVAWALQHQEQLFPNVTEESSGRANVHLLANKFIARCKAVAPQLADVLVQYRPWGQDLSSRRDPAAHRLPLQIPRTVFSQADRDRWQLLDLQRADLIRARRHAEARELLEEQDRLGAFMPMMMQAGPDGPERVVDVRAQIGKDHDATLAVVTAGVNHLYRVIRYPGMAAQLAGLDGKSTQSQPEAQPKP